MKTLAITISLVLTLFFSVVCNAEDEGVVAVIGTGDMGDSLDFGPLRMSRDIEILQMIYMIPLVQNRPEHWEFFFRRSSHYGCYRSDAYTTEGLVAPVDDNDLAEFPELGDAPTPCS
jgi:hypothetical protein